MLNGVEVSGIEPEGAWIGSLHPDRPTPTKARQLLLPGLFDQNGTSSSSKSGSKVAGCVPNPVGGLDNTKTSSSKSTKP